MKMLKMTIAITMIFTIFGVMAACGTAVQTPGSTTAGTPSTTSQTATGTPTENSTEATEVVVKEGTVVKDGNVVLKQLAFVYQDKTIALSDIVDDPYLESILGKADEIKTHTFSPDDGKNLDQLNGMTEKQYIYPGLVIKTIDGAKDKKFFVFSIEITDLKYTTIRNIQVGDSYEKLKEAYPEGNLIGGELSDQEDVYRYEPVNYVDVMNFHIKDKKIESIRIQTLLD